MIMTILANKDLKFSPINDQQKLTWQSTLKYEHLHMQYKSKGYLPQTKVQLLIYSGLGQGNSIAWNASSETSSNTLAFPETTGA